MPAIESAVAGEAPADPPPALIRPYVSEEGVVYVYIDVYTDIDTHVKHQILRLGRALYIGHICDRYTDIDEGVVYAYVDVYRDIDPPVKHQTAKRQPSRRRR